MLRLLFLLTFGLVQRALAIDVKFTEVVNAEAVTSLDISVKYSDNKQEGQKDYPSCESKESTCPTLNWDDDAKLHITYTFPEDLADKTMKEVGGKITNGVRVGGKPLGNPVKYKIQACFETPFTKNRKWRKPKAVIQDDKRCSRKIASKREIERFGEPITFDYELPSDTPKADFFITIFIFCEVEGTDDNEYCAFDTTGVLTDLAKDPRDDADVNTSNRLSYRTDVISSRPTELVVCVIVLSILSVSMLVLYFVYERAIKKTA